VICHWHLGPYCHPRPHARFVAIHWSTHHHLNCPYNTVLDFPSLSNNAGDPARHIHPLPPPCLHWIDWKLNREDHHVRHHSPGHAAHIVASSLISMAWLYKRQPPALCSPHFELYCSPSPWTRTPSPPSSYPSSFHLQQSPTFFCIGVMSSTNIRNTRDTPQSELHKRLTY
jgi:hypothetical protein